MRRLRPLPLLVLPALVPACKAGRAQLEQLVPDGATGMASVDAKGLLQTELFTRVGEGMGEASGKAREVLGTLRDRCELDLEKSESLVLGFDALSQNAMGAIRLPNVGKADALRCAGELAKEQGAKLPWEVSEADGKATVSIAGGEVLGWAMDDDTLVLGSKGWASAVQARMKGESKGAIDNNLAQAVALADRGKHVWFAGEVPGLVGPFLEQTPAAGLRRGAGSMHYGEDLEVAVAVAFADEAAAKALEGEVTPKLAEFKTLAVAGGLPQKAADSLEIVVEGEVVRGKASIPVAPVLETTTAAFAKYLGRSKTSEARVQLAKMFDGASMYFTEEHVSRSDVAVIGAGGAAMAAPHQCPNDGSPSGHAGPTPPLTVDCSKGPGGRCVPVAGEPSGPGEYSMSLWSDNPVWSAMDFQQEEPHYFHYDFRWTNDDLQGFGRCQFTAQAFGDLDGDAVFSTFERSGAADQAGVNAAAGLYIDRELE